MKKRIIKFRNTLDKKFDRLKTGVITIIGSLLTILMDFLQSVENTTKNNLYETSSEINRIRLSIIAYKTET